MLGIIRNFFSGREANPLAGTESAFEDFSFLQQIANEDEGAAAARRGLKREDCPHDKDTHPFQWNHWVFGCEMEHNRQAVRDGRVSLVMCSTDYRVPSNVYYSTETEEQRKARQAAPKALDAGKPVILHGRST